MTTAFTPDPMTVAARKLAGYSSRRLFRVLHAAHQRENAFRRAYEAASNAERAIGSSVWGDGPATIIGWHGMAWEADRNDYYDAEWTARLAFARWQRAREQAEEIASAVQLARDLVKYRNVEFTVSVRERLAAAA